MDLKPTYNGWMCPEDPGEPGTDKPRWSVNESEARVVSDLCRGLVVLEIGTGLGVSTKEIAKRAKHVFTVDVDPWVEKVVAPELPENVTFLRNIEQVPPVQAAFIDGRHSYDQCKADIEAARKLVGPDGPIIFHDVKMPAIAKAIVDSKLPHVYIETYAGMALAWNR